MVLADPTQIHLQLYEYWLERRGGRPMPSRADIDPADIPWLLPYVFLVDRSGGAFRYRLVGTAIVQEVGHDPTGEHVGQYIEFNRQAVEALNAIGLRATAAARPVFFSGQYEPVDGVVHEFSVLVLPLSDDGTRVNMFFGSRIGRFNANTTAPPGWLEGNAMRIEDVSEIADAGHLRQICFDWEARNP